MRFRSLACDGADGGAPPFDAAFDYPNANAPRSDNEFSLGPSTL